MNKLFTKVAALTLGVAMAAGVGVALGSAKASEAKAAEETVTLDFATAGLTAFASGTVNQGLSYTYVKDSGSNPPVFTKASGEAQHSLKLYNGNYLCIEISDTTSYESFKSIQCKVTSKNSSTSGTGTYYKDSMTSTSLYAHTLSSGTFVDGNTVDVDGGSKIYIKCSAGQYRIGKFVIVMNKKGDVPSTQYNVTDSVENGSVSPSKVNEGATLTATITPDTGYNVPETVSVTMGGVAATHSYENGVVTVQNVTGDVEITGSCVEIPVTPEPAVVETTFADFIAATDADYAKAYHFSATIKAFKTGDTKDKYGNMTLTDGTTDLTVYGSTADATKLVWNGVSEKYEFTNPQDFMTTDLTNDSNVGDTVEVKFIRYFHSNKLNGQGIILSVTPGETPEIPEPEMVTGKKLSDLFADTAGNGKQLYEVTGVVSKWKDNTSTDATQYGNFYLKESLDSDTEYYIYGATADATKLVWGTASGVYGFSNPKDFLTNEVTKDVVIGSTLTMRLTRCDYGKTLEANGIVVSVVPPAPTDWSDAQKTAFAPVLDGFVPGYFGAPVADPTVNVNNVQFAVSGDLTAAAETYFATGWQEDQGYYVQGTQNGVVQASFTVENNVTYFIFQFIENQPVLSEWTDEQKTFFAGALEGVVPPFLGDEFAHGTIDTQYGEYSASATGDFTTQIETACASWLADEGAFLKQTTHGYAVIEYAYKDETTSVSVYFYQTSWFDEQIADFQLHLGGYVPTFNSLVNSMSYRQAQDDYLFVYYGDYVAKWTSYFAANNIVLVDGQQSTYYVKTSLGAVYFQVQTQGSGTSVATIVFMWYVADPIPTSLDVDASAVKSNYYVGDELDPTGISAKVLDENGEEIDYGVDITQFLDYDYDFSQPGVVTVTVSIEPKQGVVLTDSFEVNVAAVELAGIEVTGEMSKTSYTDDDEWSTAGLTVYAVYNNGSKVDVTNEATWTFTPEKPEIGVTSVSAVASFSGFDAEAVVTTVSVDHVYDANAFAKDLLDMVAPICANYDGKKNNKAALKTVWDTMSQRYSTLSNEEKAKIIAAAAKTDGTDLEKAMAFYNYACKKYGLTKFIEGRQVKALVTEHETGNSILPIVVIVASSVAAITAIGVVIALKRRKALLAK